MISARHIRKSSRRRAYARAFLVLAAASALLFARANSVKAPQGRSLRAVQTAGHHYQCQYQRLRFDKDEPRCCVSLGTSFTISPPRQVHADLTIMVAVFSSLHTGGDHYSRPPPAI